MQTFGERLAYARVAAGISQVSLAHYLNEAAKTGATEKSIREWEKNRRWPHASLVPHLARILGVTTDWLYCLTDDPKGSAPTWPLGSEPPAD